MAKVFMFYQVLKAFIWKNIYANVSSMFDVSGENQEADNDSNKQKAMLVDILEKMKFAQTSDEVINKFLIHGELITMVSWKKKSKEYRKKIEVQDLINPKAVFQLTKGKFYFIDEKPVYDNPFVEAVNPYYLAFDVSQKDNWDECPKIYKSYQTAEAIINNKYYNVSKEVAEELRAVCKGNEATSQTSEALDNQTVNGSTVEVLEHWGNLTLKDGTTLKNWHVVIVNRKHLVRFKENAKVINPFTYATLIEDPETKRGISPLYCLLSLANMQEDLMNRTCDMQSLSEAPPVFAPKGFFKTNSYKIAPAKIIEYGDNLSPDQIKPMQFDVNVFLNDISFLSDIMAEVSGIFPNMAGADESRAKTATEISTKAQGQMTRLTQMIDTINQGFIIPCVEKVAELKANFTFGEEEIFVNGQNDKETLTIDDSIRQAEYRYTYSDRIVTADRSNKADMVAQACQQFAQFVPLNATELFTWYMEQKEVENPERFLQLQPQLPQAMQNQLLEDPRIQQLAEVYNQMEANGESPDASKLQNNADVPEANTMEQ